MKNFFDQEMLTRELDRPFSKKEAANLLEIDEEGLKIMLSKKGRRRRYRLKKGDILEVIEED